MQDQTSGLWWRFDDEDVKCMGMAPTGFPHDHGSGAKNKEDLRGSEGVGSKGGKEKRGGGRKGGQKRKRGGGSNRGKGKGCGGTGRKGRRAKKDNVSNDDDDDDGVIEDEEDEEESYVEVCDVEDPDVEVDVEAEERRVGREDGAEQMEVGLRMLKEGGEMT